jgi:hypothetical protein
MNFNIFNKNTKYIYENILKDPYEIEEKRQYIQHLLLYKACDEKIFLSPIDGIMEYGNNMILNLGSGYSIWTNHVNSIYYNKKIYTNFIYDIDINKDLNPYELTDLRKDRIKFYDNVISFIYQRDMITVYKIDEWFHVINEIYRLLKKDGYAEFVEYNIYVGSNEKQNYYSDIINKYLEKIYNKNNIKDICDIIEQIFKNIKIEIKKLPLYNENIFEGKCVENVIMGYKHFKTEISYTINYKYNITYKEYIDLLKKEWENNKSCIEIYIITVKK